MHFVSVNNCLTAVALLSHAVLAINPKHHSFFKRQGCNNIESQCGSVGTTLSDCVNYVCRSCTNVDPSIPQCCQLSTDLSIGTCIEENLSSASDSNDESATATSRSGATSTGFSEDTNITAEPGCSSLVSKAEACESATPGFNNLSRWGSEASCFCYEGSSYQPSSFDNYYSSCLAYLSTADSDLYSELTLGDSRAISTPCAAVGDVRATPASTGQGVSGGAGVNTASFVDPIPGSSPAGQGTTPTSSGTTPTSSSIMPTVATGGNADNTAAAAGNSVDGMPLKSAVALFASFVALLYLL
ncbi:MAG: hypothetical protein Q9173_006367 [Seirophora scorigena]